MYSYLATLNAKQYILMLWKVFSAEVKTGTIMHSNIIFKSVYVSILSFYIHIYLNISV